MSRIGTVVILNLALLLFACFCAGYRMKAIESRLSTVEGECLAFNPVRESAYKTESQVRGLRKWAEDHEAVNQQAQQAIGDLRQRMGKCEAGECCGCKCDSKLPAVSPFAPFSRITGAYFTWAIPGVQQCDDAEAGAAMQKALDQARDLINRSEVLFDVAYCEDMDRYFEVFRQFNRVSVTRWHEYRLWIADITNHFDDVMRDRIAVLEGKEGKGVRMPLAAIPYAQRIKMKPAEYLDAHRKHWERSKKTASVPPSCPRSKFCPCTPPCGCSECRCGGTLPAPDMPLLTARTEMHGNARKCTEMPKPGTPLTTAVVHDGQAHIAWIDEDGRRQERAMTEEEFCRLNAKDE